MQFPGLVGVLPGFGRQEPNDWGLGFELRDGKSPHWTGTRNSPGTFGHFGRSGTFLWVDPDARVALGCLTDLDFGDWAVDRVAGPFGRRPGGARAVTRRGTEQVTQCYKLPTARRSRRFRASNTVLLGLLVAVGAMASAGCGGGSPATVEQRPAVPAGALPGWTAVDDPPGVPSIAPDFRGLDVSGRSDAQALVKDGDAIRATTFIFATEKRRARGEEARGRRRLPGRARARISRRHRRPRPGCRADGSASRGRPARASTRSRCTSSPTGAKLTVVELESATGFDPALRAQVLRLLSR